MPDMDNQPACIGTPEAQGEAGSLRCLQDTPSQSQGATPKAAARASASPDPGAPRDAASRGGGSSGVPLAPQLQGQQHQTADPSSRLQSYCPDFEDASPTGSPSAASQDGLPEHCSPVQPGAASAAESSQEDEQGQVGLAAFESDASLQVGSSEGPPVSESQSSSQCQPGERQSALLPLWCCCLCATGAFGCCCCCGCI